MTNLFLENLIKYLPKQKIEILDTRFLLEENNKIQFIYIFKDIYKIKNKY